MMNHMTGMLPPAGGDTSFSGPSPYPPSSYPPAFPGGDVHGVSGLSNPYPPSSYPPIAGGPPTAPVRSPAPYDAGSHSPAAYPPMPGAYPTGSAPSGASYPSPYPPTGAPGYGPPSHGAPGPYGSSGAYPTPGYAPGPTPGGYPGSSPYGAPGAHGSAPGYGSPAPYGGGMTHGASTAYGGSSGGTFGSLLPVAAGLFSTHLGGGHKAGKTGVHGMTGPMPTGPHRVEVTLLEFSGLRRVQLLGKQDPFAEVCVNGMAVGKTKVLVDAGTSGSFAETLWFQTNLSSDTMTIVFKDRGSAGLEGPARLLAGATKIGKTATKDTEIGRADFRLGELMSAHEIDRLLPVSGAAGAVVHLRLRWVG